MENPVYFSNTPNSSNTAMQNVNTGHIVILFVSFPSRPPLIFRDNYILSTLLYMLLSVMANELGIIITI